MRSLSVTTIERSDLLKAIINVLLPSKKMVPYPKMKKSWMRRKNPSLIIKSKSLPKSRSKMAQMMRQKLNQWQMGRKRRCG